MHQLVEPHYSSWGLLVLQQVSSLQLGLHFQNTFASVRTRKIALPSPQGESGVHPLPPLPAGKTVFEPTWRAHAAS